MSKNMCPCCGLYELSFAPGGDDICGICKWQDDIVQLKDPEFTGGANDISLNQARALFKQGKDNHGKQILLPLIPNTKASQVVLACNVVSVDGIVGIQA